MQNIPEVINQPFNINAEFIKLTIFNDTSNLANINVYTFSSSYKTETIGNLEYSPMGGLLAVGVQNRDLRVTSADTSISLSGIDGNNIYVVLDKKIKGSEIEIIRGFYDNNFVLQNTYTRFTGIVTSYNINEDRSEKLDNFTVTLNASSYKTVLENRIAGRKTNKTSWQVFNSTDSSMNNITSIAGQNFDFGKPSSSKTNNTSGASLESQIGQELPVNNPNPGFEGGGA
jgi:hypothetical protein